MTGIRFSAKNFGSDFERDFDEALLRLLGEFEVEAERISRERNLRPASVRTNIPYDHFIGVCKDKIWVVGRPSTGGVVSEQIGDLSDQSPTADEIMQAAQWDLGFVDPFAYSVRRDLLNGAPEERAAEIQAIASQWVSSEESRVAYLTNVISMEPLFGPAAFVLQPRLCFVMMPFANELKRIYTEVIKPTIESRDLMCLRADDIRTNGAIMDHVWKSICEARFLIADLTFGNANVFYELGIAHAVGKETILIARRMGESPKRPFDVLHLRTILYDDTPDGRSKLRTELDLAIREIIEPTIIS